MNTDVAEGRRATQAHRGFLCEFGPEFGILCALLRAQGVPLCLLRHPRTRAAAEKQRLFPEGVAVQKTVTLKIDHHLILISGPGDFRLRRAQLTACARILAGRGARSSTINPSHQSGQRLTGLPVGMISPFLRISAARCTPLAAIFLLLSISKQYHSIAISLSLESSLVIPFETLVPIVDEYARNIYPHIPVLLLS